MPLVDGVRLADGDALTVADSVAVRLLEGEGVAVQLPVALGVVEGLLVAVPVGLAEAVADAEPVLVAVGVRVAVAVSLDVPVADRVRGAVWVVLHVEVGVPVGVAELLEVGVAPHACTSGQPPHHPRCPGRILVLHLLFKGRSSLSMALLMVLRQCALPASET